MPTHSWSLRQREESCRTSTLRFRKVPDAFASLFRFAGVAKIQRHSHRIFGVVALLLATTGVFGVMAYSVSRRTREIGVRVALGAGSGDVLRMILSQGLRTIFIGVAIGLPFAGTDTHH